MRVVWAVDPNSTVKVYPVGKSSTLNPREAGKRVNENSFVWNGSVWELDPESDAFLLKRWSKIPVEGYTQQYVAVGPVDNSEPGELLIGNLLRADQISGSMFVNVSPCGRSESQPYLGRGGPGHALVIGSPPTAACRWPSMPRPIRRLSTSSRTRCLGFKCARSCN